jgi:hypothetical protein
MLTPTFGGLCDHRLGTIGVHFLLPQALPDDGQEGYLQRIYGLFKHQSALPKIRCLGLSGIVEMSRAMPSIV